MGGHLLRTLDGLDHPVHSHEPPLRRGHGLEPADGREVLQDRGRPSDGAARGLRGSSGPQLRGGLDPDQGAHPALVSHRLFQAAQSGRANRGGSETQRKAGSRRLASWSGRRSRFLLSGLLECARCGGRYQGCRRTKGRPRNDGTPVHTYYYGCGNYIRKGTSACRFGPRARRSSSSSWSHPPSKSCSGSL